MIINLNLEGKKIIIIGGGNEAEKRIKSILNFVIKRVADPGIINSGSGYSAVWSGFVIRNVQNPA